MLAVDLREYEEREVELSLAQRRALLEHGKDLALTIEPTGRENIYRLTPGSTVGALEIGSGIAGLSVSIAPKLDIRRVLFLASHALEKFKLRDRQFFDYPETGRLVEALARLFLAAGRRAFSRGLLRGYRTEEEALHTVRGRIRFDDQLRRRFGIPLPVEVRYDEYTEDVTPNRLVKAAAHALGAMRFHDADSRTELGRIAATLGNVALCAYPPQEVPEVAFDRLNGHYREVVGLSRLILQHATVETGRGAIRAAGFRMDMNEVFQQFVTRALRRELRLTEQEFPPVTKTHLDIGKRVPMYPDLSWWRGNRCVFVGDAKYKAIEDRHAPNADLYQLLAYATALDLPGGMLIYGNGAPAAQVHVVRNSGKRLEAMTLDLSGEPETILGGVSEIAARIRAMAEHRRQVAQAA